MVGTREGNAWTQTLYLFLARMRSSPRWEVWNLIPWGKELWLGLYGRVPSTYKTDQVLGSL